jgi:hypothetical protein
LIGWLDRRDHATEPAAGQGALAGIAEGSRIFAGLLSLPLLKPMPRFFEIIFTAQ